MGEYYIIITDAGVALEAAAHAAGEPVTLTTFGVCDGGTAFTPDPTQTALANEVYRGDISSLSVSAADASVLEAQCIIPASSGGYTIRGIGLYAGDTLYAVGNYPDQPKPAPDSGYAASLEILAQLAVSDTADVTLNVTDGAWLTKEEGDQIYAPLTRKVNGHALSEDVNVTAQDIFNGQAVAIGDAVDLNTLTTPGLYYQTTNIQAQNGQNYPEPAAGSLEVYKHAGITQVYRIYANSGTYIRALHDDTWSDWTLQYDVAHKPTPADIGAVPASGGSVAYLENATYYKTNPDGWYGGGAFADQYQNNAAPFLVPYGFESAKETSQYLPIIKGISHTAEHGYAAAVSFGILRSGNADFGSAVIHIIGDSGAGATYVFDANGVFNAPVQVYSGGTVVAAGDITSSGGNIHAAGQVDSGGNIVAGQGLYESGGAVRVYSSNNPPPQQDLSPYATQAWTVANFLQGGIRLASLGVATNGNNDNEFAYAPDGAVVTAVQQKTNYTAVQYRYVQYNIGGNWYTAWVA
ncbi:phage tail-collar fiber domain-containing protein [Enterobacter asburiae]|uniref:phage tail-collar fiber domain-containing protein n=1 Tax=Enterobacter asburiae TaxID=61645 RepID=UPI001575A910|nr:phage tail protein [Enterobacter asburiae]NQF31042.1 hypothetical protein [Enterobacter asburiae]